MKKINIAIDGPASSGKSTVAKILAQHYGYVYTDTGAMYRSITYLALKTGCSLEDESGLVALIDTYPITFAPTETGQDVFVDGTKVTEEIQQQQKIAENGGVVMDGRDIGTAVLPQAEVKVFLVASVEERAERRYKENQQKGITTSFDTLKKEIEQRDYLDSHREISPLKQADDAVRIDTTGMSITEVVAAIQQIVDQKME